MDEIKLEFGDAPTMQAEGESVILNSMPQDKNELADIQKQNDEKMLQEANLTPEELKTVDDFAEKIDITNTAAVLQYGVTTQNKMADFSDKVLNDVKTKDMGEIGGMLTSLVGELRSMDMDDNDKGIVAFFKKKTDKLAALKTKYNDVETNVTKISHALEDHQVVLMKDINMLDKMYEMNLNYFKEITMYILAGKKKIQHAKEVEYIELKDRATQSGLPEDAQKVKDFEEMINRFEKKISDLELSRMIALQTAPQIRLVQSSDTTMMEKIQTTLVNTIPLWKNQMIISLGVEHSLQAAEAQHMVSDMTNELLKKNAQALKTATIETAKESERGIVDIETLKNTNEMLISTLDEVVKIQTEGREKRAKAEIELQSMENQLKQKMLERATK